MDEKQIAGGNRGKQLTDKRIEVIQITDLVTEYHRNPLGIEEPEPRLSWKIKSETKSIFQGAYQIKCALSEEDLKSHSNLIWDSGKVTSEQSIHVKYKGLALQSRQKVFWQVKVWINQTESQWSETAFWEMGLLKRTDWKARWIEPDLEENKTTSNPCPLLRKEFSVHKEIKQARVYVTAHGLYQLRLNGKKVGDEEFTPGWTTYQKRLQYQVYDVTQHVQQGKNVVGAIAGDGWYRGFFGWQGEKNHYGERTALLCQLEITFTDNSTQLICSDKNWRSSTGPILSSDIYHGEIYDSRLEKTGWDLEAFDAQGWSAVVEKDYDLNRLTASEGSKIKVTKRVQPIQKITTPKGETVLDFGQNLVGRVRFSVNGKKGEKITISHAEVLDLDGNFYTANLRAAKQQIQYYFKGNETETYKPHFTFMGFRYVKIEGYGGEINLSNFSAEVIHSDMDFTGTFECSDKLINQLQQNIQWGLRGNFLDVPTDCPQRDERMGWTGDAQVFAPTACFNANAAPFFTKWLKDLQAEQREDGSVPWVVPNLVKNGGGTGWSDGFGATGWADAAIIIPWVIYRAYGDIGILEKQYASMKAWEEYMIREAGESYLFNSGFHFGDWLSFAEYSSYIYNAPDYGFAGAHTEKDLIATAYFYYSTLLMEKTANILGNQEEAKKYKNLLPKIREAFAKEFITPNGRLISNTQAAYALALTFGVLPKKYIQKAADLLAKNVVHFQHLTTGFLGTPVLCDALSDAGRSDLAYQLLFNRKYPSWLYPVTKGATTIWERWDGIKPDGTFQNEGMNSFNHYAYGAIGNWLYTRAAGIQSHPQFPGYKKIIIKPELTKKLDFVKASLNSMYGEICSGWERNSGKLKLTVTIPPNTTATVFVPEKKNQYSTHEMSSGTFVFESKID